MSARIGFDRIAAALGHRVRRRVLVELLAHNPVAATRVRADERRDESDRVEVELVHVHLPKLDDMGYVAWDRDRERITKGPNWEEIEPVIRLLTEHPGRVPADTF